MNKRTLYIIATVLMISWIVAFIIDGSRLVHTLAVFAFIFYIEGLTKAPRQSARLKVIK